MGVNLFSLTEFIHTTRAGAPKCCYKKTVRKLDEVISFFLKKTKFPTLSFLSVFCVRYRLQISLLILSEFKRIIQLLVLLKPRRFYFRDV